MNFATHLLSSRPTAPEEDTMKKLTRTATVALTLAAAAFAGVVTTSHDASACGGAWAPAIFMEEIDHRPEAVSRAEKQAEQRQMLAAAGSVIRSMPHVRQLNAKRSTLVARAQRTLAIALARTGGQLDIERELPAHIRGQWLGKTAEDRKANLEWAVSVLRQVSEIKKNEPAVQTELAEALAQLDEHQGEARNILEDLARRDIVASAEGWSTLARLRTAGGDTGGAKVALDRCAAMATAGMVCGQVATGKAAS